MNANPHGCKVCGNAPGRCTCPPNTRHLDTAIGILKGTGASKRAPRKADVTLVLMGEPRHGSYTIQSNGKLVEEGCNGGLDRLNKRADAVRALGKTVRVEVL